MKCLEKGSKVEIEFARTLAKRAHTIKANKKRYAAARVLKLVNSKAKADTRKRAREEFDDIVGEDEETLRLISMWQQVYSIHVEYPKSHQCHKVSFDSQVNIYTFEV